MFANFRIPMTSSGKAPKLVGSALALLCLSSMLSNDGLQPTSSALAADSKSKESGQSADSAAQAKAKEQKDRAALYPKSPPKNAPSVCWSDPNVEPKVALLCIHGLSLHKGAFADFGKEICKHGIIAYAIDLRSFGESKRNDYSALDFDGIMADIKQALENIHKQHPNLKVLILGESMGGAIALRATALYPELIDGLISSTPARDHYSLADAAPKVISGTLFGGLSAPIKNLGSVVIEHVSKKEDLKRHLKADPMMRMTFSPSELLSFDKYMAKNFEIAALIKETPVLFIQGVNDKLIKPAGTWKLFDRLGTPNRQIVFSKSTEHLIFEANQFTPEDIKFVKSWVNSNIAKLPSQDEVTDPLLALLPGHGPGAKASPRPSPDGSESPASDNATSTEDNASQEPIPISSESGSSPDTVATIAMIPPNYTQTVPTAAPSTVPASKPIPSTINYWIELYRKDTFYRCNNKTIFRSGDAIRFHVIPESAGYVYLLITDNATGVKHALFPNPKAGTKNNLQGKRDYALPETSWLKFDQKTGTERLSLIFSKTPLEVPPEELHPSLIKCVVSSEPGKDNIPKEMSVTWKEVQPVPIPTYFPGVSQTEPNRGSSLVRVAAMNERGLIATEIALSHR